jgi:hypothetical protein
VECLFGDLFSTAVTAVTTWSSGVVVISEVACMCLCTGRARVIFGSMPYLDLLGISNNSFHVKKSVKEKVG